MINKSFEIIFEFRCRSITVKDVHERTKKLKNSFMLSSG